MKKSIIAILMGGVIGFTSCDSFLDEAPQSSITPEGYFTDADQLGYYTMNYYNFGGVNYYNNDGGTDNQNGSYSNKFASNQAQVFVGVDQGGGWDFGTIRACNYFFEQVNQRLEQNAIAGEKSMIDHCIGEMYMIRANAYFDKLQTFGDFPIVTTVLPNDLQILTDSSRRVPRNEVARFILSDLQKAADLMLDESPDGNNLRLSSYCAKLLASRVALYEATWLQNFKGTPFVPGGQGWPGEETYKGYQYPAGGLEEEVNFFLDVAMKNAKEVADHFPLTTNTMASMIGMDAAADEEVHQSFAEACFGNNYVNMYSAIDKSAYPEVLMWKAYSRALGMTNQAFARIEQSAHVCYTRSGVDCYLMKNGLPIYASNSGYKGDKTLPDTRFDRDGRIWLFLKEEGQLNDLDEATTGSSGEYAIIVEPKPQLFNANGNLRNPTGYASRKGSSFDAAEKSLNSQAAEIMFRATEAYLNYIEACYLRKGTLDGSATMYWKSIRERAGVNTDLDLTDQNTNIAKEAETDWAAYTAGELLTDTRLFNIRRERRCELMGEGFRWMDLKRWRALDQLKSKPYFMEGFNFWDSNYAMYDPAEIIDDKSGSATMSPKSDSKYYRFMNRTDVSNVFKDGMRWMMGYYLDPIPQKVFTVASSDGEGSDCPIYQNPYWEKTGNTPVQN
ncbi:RagB/SusD family nutrient uptake outer membrane protein [uncultured Parabacteroides sp.]|uniref:RagB/SusD family nutrient uptake outer membrane protein n=1 Tax=uncultured Parabacteroides sp. TaxID=512312 RepID=UPI0025955291|nr:RagB/SusD family nutrient uptake outer membrane protein [uncultured Parabacteroides sp.]